MRNDNNLPITLLRDLNGVTEVTDAAIDLDFIVKELLKSADVKDLVRGRLGRVDNELYSSVVS